MKAAQVKTVLTVESLHREGQARHADCAIVPESARGVSGGRAHHDLVRRQARGIPRRHRRPRVARKADDPSVVLFTSGSEGTPKGVVLSHRNILANAAQALARVDANANDKVFNVLPVFHSFGLHRRDDDACSRGHPHFHVSVAAALPHRAELIYQTGATILFGTGHLPRRLRPLGATPMISARCASCSPVRKR